MVETHSFAAANTDHNINSGGIHATGGDPLAVIAAKLDMIEELRDKVASLEVQSRNSAKKKIMHWGDEPEEEGETYQRNRTPYAKIDFPKFCGGDPRGWVLKAEKFFRYYQTPEDGKVEIAAMYLEGDALDLFSWMNSERTLLYWEELVKTLNEHYGPPKFLNPDEHLCSIKQIGTVAEYRQEWARRVARVTNWPDHCLLGVFLNGLTEELRTEVHLHKPRTVYRESSLALELEKVSGSGHGFKAGSNMGQTHSSNPAFCRSNTNNPIADSSAPSSPLVPPWASGPSKQNGWHTSSSTSSPASIPPSSSEPSRQNGWDSIRQQRRDKGLCFRCSDPFRPGHRCTSASLSLLEVVDGQAPMTETPTKNGDSSRN